MKTTITVEQAKQVLKEAGYYVDNLWSTEDVKMVKSDLTEAQCYLVLQDTFNNDYIVSEINDTIVTVVEELYIDN